MKALALIALLALVAGCADDVPAPTSDAPEAAPDVALPSCASLGCAAVLCQGTDGPCFCAGEICEATP
jgi:hypothetical protein